MAETDKVASTRLNSWKEIAAFLGRGVRTAQRWERELQLPVHRIGKGSRSPVYALITELKFWLATSDAMRTEPAHGAPPRRAAGKPVEDSRRLTSKIHTLVREVAENSLRQRRQAETLEKRILEMRSRMKSGRREQKTHATLPPN
jgi:hypothetical protein